MFVIFYVFLMQKTAYEMRISDWSSDVCSSDLESPTEPVFAWPASHRHCGWQPCCPAACSLNFEGGASVLPRSSSSSSPLAPPARRPMRFCAGRSTWTLQSDQKLLCLGNMKGEEIDRVCRSRAYARYRDRSEERGAGKDRVRTF